MTSTEERFWANVRKTETCWLWTKGVSRRGYGVFYFGDTSAPAHRYAWALSFGEIPASLNVCHKCDNPPCVRPDHLFVGTQADNMKDMVQKGRSAHVFGLEANSAKLSDEQVLAVRDEILAGSEAAEVSKKFGIAKSYVSGIKTANRPRIKRLDPTYAGVTRNLSDECIKEVQHDLLEGRTPSEICERLKISVSVVSHIRMGRRRTKNESDLFAKDHFRNIPRKQQTDLYRGVDIASLYFVEMMSLAQIAQKMGVCREAIGRWLRERGFKLRPRRGE